MRLLNIGCGTTFHPSWTNIDNVPAFPGVLKCDVRKGLPFDDEAFDAVYSSHIMEHLRPLDTEKLVREIYRILKPKGIVRVVVPDLEGIVLTYLKCLEKAQEGNRNIEQEYDWMMLELFDQAVRSEPGGEMRKYLETCETSVRSFILQRIGHEAQRCWSSNAFVWKSFVEKAGSFRLIHLIRSARLILAEILVGLVAGKHAKGSFREGLFRDSGEIHRWMYDSFSLRRLLENASFAEVMLCSPDKSRIPNFNSYQLDIADGKIRKPDSIFMEALKL